MTKTEMWAADTDAQKWLKSFIESPMGAFFLAVLEEKSELRQNANLAPGFLTVNGPALSGSILGYERCLQNIRNLCDPSTVTPHELKENYGVTDPKHATE